MKNKGLTVSLISIFCIGLLFAIQTSALASSDISAQQWQGESELYFYDLDQNLTIKQIEGYQLQLASDPRTPIRLTYGYNSYQKYQFGQIRFLFLADDNAVNQSGGDGSDPQDLFFIDLNYSQWINPKVTDFQNYESFSCINLGITKEWVLQKNEMVDIRFGGEISLPVLAGLNSNNPSLKEQTRSIKGSNIGVDVKASLKLAPGLSVVCNGETGFNHYSEGSVVGDFFGALFKGFLNMLFDNKFDWEVDSNDTEIPVLDKVYRRLNLGLEYTF